MQYIKKETGAYNLHFIKTKKFKTIKIKINFKELISKEKIVYRNMLSLILLEATKTYNTRRLIDIECENLYNIGVGAGSSISGNYQILSFNTTFLNEKYTEVGMNEKSLQFFLDFIFNPNVTDNKFLNQAFLNAKNILKEDIESFNDIPSRYAFSKLYESMCPNTSIAYRNTGYMEDLESITVENLYEYYQELLKKDIVDIFVIGDIDINQFEELIKHNFKVNTLKRNNVSHFIEQTNFKRIPKVVKEAKNVNQSILIVASKLKDITPFERLYVLSVYNHILGGGPDSKLFQEVREKNSLCYYITSTHTGVYNLELISAGIDLKNYEKALKLIKHEIKEMAKGNFTDEDIEKAKINAKAALKEIEDAPGGMVSIYEAHEYLGYDLLEEREKNIDKVTKEDIMKVIKKIKMDTIFLLEGSKRDAKEDN